MPKSNIWCKWANSGFNRSGNQLVKCIYCGNKQLKNATKCHEHTSKCNKAKINSSMEIDTGESVPRQPLLASQEEASDSSPDYTHLNEIDIDLIPETDIEVIFSGNERSRSSTRAISRSSGTLEQYISRISPKQQDDLQQLWARSM